MEQPMIAPPAVPDQPDDDDLPAFLIALVREANTRARPPLTLVPRCIDAWDAYVRDVTQAESTLDRYRVAQGDEPEAA